MTSTASFRAYASAFACAGLSLSGCGGLVELDAAAVLGSGGAAPTHVGSGTGGAGTGGPVNTEPEQFCMEVCADLHLHSCVSLLCESGACEEHTAGWDVPTRGAFSACMKEDPLCFTTLEGCMLDVLFPPPAPRLHRVSIENVEGTSPHHVWAGAYAPNQPEAFLSQAITTETTLSFVWEQPWWGDFGPTFCAWVDLDRDGLCESGQDRFGAATAIWNGSFEKPEYDARVYEYYDDGAAVCPTLGFEDVGILPEDD